MEKISILEAKRDSKWQEYIDYIVEASGHDFKYVKDIKTVSDEEARKNPRKYFGVNEDKYPPIKMICKPIFRDGFPIGVNIFVPEICLNDAANVVPIHASLDDIDKLYTMRLTKHEDLHATHIMEGLYGFNINDKSNYKLRLFNILAELEAHKNEFEALDKLYKISRFLSDTRGETIIIFNEYLGLLEENKPKIGFENINIALERYQHFAEDNKGCLENHLKRKRDIVSSSNLTQIIVSA